MARGILQWVGLGATLFVAAHLGLFGAERVLAGEHLLGGAFLALAVAALALEEYVTKPTDLPGSVAGKLVGAVVEEPEDD
jgi:hypothetical protein